MTRLLEVVDLNVSFPLATSELRPVRGVTFHIEAKEILGIVGESGCGKSLTALAIMDLLPRRATRRVGTLSFGGRDLPGLSPRRMNDLRGDRMAMIFQEPITALNPVYTIGDQITEVLRLHRSLGKHEAQKVAIELLGETGIPEPEKRVKAYPFELSGGMQQRALIAIAISGRPKLLIADEPTTALDVTVQAEILDLLAYLQEQYGMAILLISHDIGVVADVAQRIMVMYSGKVVEVADTEDLFRDPRHPYTQALLKSVPQLGAGHNEPLHGIPGAVPDFLDLPSGCTFHPRCTIGDSSCTSEFPPLVDIGYRRKCACYKAETG